jgi:hypothetical protein
MSKKLWKVKVELPLLVLGEDKKEAKRVALESILSELQDSYRKLRVVCEVTNKGSVPPGWLDRIPYGRFLSRLLEGRTVREIIEHRLFVPRDRREK